LSDASGSSTCLDLPLEEPRCPPGASLYPHVLPGLWCADAGLNATGTVLEWAAAVFAGGDLAGLEVLAAGGPPGCDGLLFWPSLADGERTDAAASGGWSHLSLRHGRAHLARAVYEGLTFALCAVGEGLRGDALPVTTVRISGGASQSCLWNQLKADIFGWPVVACRREAAALGAALLAGVATRLFTSWGEAVTLCAVEGPRYEPQPAQAALYRQTYRSWLAARAACPTRA
jgi:sugar (pentulose or hexulose) kinase